MSPTASLLTSFTATKQRDLYMCPINRNKKKIDGETVEPVEYLCLQITGMEEKTVEEEPEFYPDATVGIFTLITHGDIKKEGRSHHLEMARNMDVTLSENRGRWTLDARTQGKNSFGSVNNASVFMKQQVYKDTMGNTLFWRDQHDGWTGFVDVTDTPAQGLWSEPDLPPISLNGSLAGQAVTGKLIQSTEGAVKALSSLR